MKHNRNLLLICIVLICILVIFFAVGAPAWKNNCQTENFDQIDAGTSYTDYPFWSLYGWRICPPYEYPQKTINTFFDKVMTNCGQWCNQTQDPSGCLQKCHFTAAKLSLGKEGFSSKIIDDVPCRDVQEKTTPFCFYK